MLDLHLRKVPRGRGANIRVEVNGATLFEASGNEADVLDAFRVALLTNNDLADLWAVAMQDRTESGVEGRVAMDAFFDSLRQTN